MSETTVSTSLTEQLSCPLAKDGFPLGRFQLLFAQRNFLHCH